MPLLLPLSRVTFSVPIDIGINEGHGKGFLALLSAPI